MPRRDELPAEAVSLELLDKALEERRLSHLEKMGKGMSKRDYLEHVGRAKECAAVQVIVAARLKQLHDGDEE